MHATDYAPIYAVQYLMEDEKSVRTAIHQSRVLMKGWVGEMAWLYISFTGLVYVVYIYTSLLICTADVFKLHALPE